MTLGARLVATSHKHLPTEGRAPNLERANSTVAKANLLEREGNHRPPEVPQMPLMLSVDELDGVLYAARMIAIDG